MFNLPNLEGSEKQITWANDIRQKFIRAIGGMLVSSGHKQFQGEAGLEELAELFNNNQQVRQAYHWIDNPSAKFWIDRRNWTLGQIMQEAK